MSSLSEIIERVEKAGGQSRELDALIECEVRRLQAYAVGLSDETRAHWNPIGSKGEVIDNQGLCRYQSPAYTSSIDTALTLLPEGWEWELSWIYGRACAKLGDPVLSIDCDGSTPALALVAACLKARLLDAASSEARG
jgi:hypothetical protein